MNRKKTTFSDCFVSFSVEQRISIECSIVANSVKEWKRLRIEIKPQGSLIIFDKHYMHSDSMLDIKRKILAWIVLVSGNTEYDCIGGTPTNTIIITTINKKQRQHQQQQTNNCTQNTCIGNFASYIHSKCVSVHKIYVYEKS